jgi:MinD-like ATPase involved in chromosome partitioning or flagellar assembly
MAQRPNRNAIHQSPCAADHLYFHTAEVSTSMEIILGLPSLDRSQELAVALAMHDVTVRAVCSTCAELVGQVARSPVDGVVLVEELPDGPPDIALRQLLGIPGQRPVAVILAYRQEGRELLRERVRATYGLAADLIMAGARPATDVAPEIASLLHTLLQTVRAQDLAAHERLSRPVAEAAVPKPVLRSGLVSFLGVSGGVGTSTLVANLGAVAALSGRRVLLVDAQLAAGPSLLYHLGVADAPDYPGVHVLRHDYEAARGLVTGGALDAVEQALVPVTLSRLRHPPLHLLQVPNEPQNRTSMRMEHLLWAVQVLAESRRYDTILVDAGTGVGDSRTQQLLQASSDLLLLAANRGASVNSLLKLVPFLGALDLRAKPLLLLRSYDETAYTDKYVHNMTHLTGAGIVPHEPAIERRESRQHSESPAAVSAADLPYSRAVAALALRLGLVEAGFNPAPAPPPKAGLFSRLTGR